MVVAISIFGALCSSVHPLTGSALWPSIGPSASLVYSCVPRSVAPWSSALAVTGGPCAGTGIGNVSLWLMAVVIVLTEDVGEDFVVTCEPG